MNGPGIGHYLKCKRTMLRFKFEKLKREFDDPSPKSVTWSLFLLAGFLVFLYLPLAGVEINLSTTMIGIAYLHSIFIVLRFVKVTGDAPHLFYAIGAWLLSPILVNGLGLGLSAIGLNYIADNLRLCQAAVLASPFAIGVLYVFGLYFNIVSTELYRPVAPNGRSSRRR